MMSNLDPMVSEVCFVACHAGPAAHFATFAEHLSRDGSTINIYALKGPALDTFQRRWPQQLVSKLLKIPKRCIQSGTHLTAFSIPAPTEEDEIAELIAKRCSTAPVVITDVGHPFAAKVQGALAKYAKVRRLTYYDNDSLNVPGQYPQIAAGVMGGSQGILCANAHLADEPTFEVGGSSLIHLKRVGIGYFPVEQAYKIAKRRQNERTSLRETFLQDFRPLPEGTKVLLYYGGNNDEYFDKALPAFLDIIENGMKRETHSDFSNLLIIFRQHPGAIKDSKDLKEVRHRLCVWDDKGFMLKAPRVIFSRNSDDTSLPPDMRTDRPPEDLQVIADMVMYFQTTMSSQVVLAGIPTTQVGHLAYQDVVVKNRLVRSVTTADEFVDVVEKLKPNQQQDIPRDVILHGLGFKEEWLDILKKTLENHRSTTKRPSVLPYLVACGLVCLVAFVALRVFRLT